MLDLLSIEYDGRLHSYCVNARCDYAWFVGVVQGAERNLQIQRQIIREAKAYATLRADLKRGCVLPPLVLAAKNLGLPARLRTVQAVVDDTAEEAGLLDQLADSIENISPDNLYIIDGLQRTNAIRQVSGEIENVTDRQNFLQRRMRFEVWLNIPFGALAYRMLLLNAGQRPMAIKHQVEILSMKLQEELAEIPGMEILTTTEGRRRTRAGQFQLALLSQAFQAWLQGQPNLDLRNLVMEQLLAESAIETLGASLIGNTPEDTRDDFKEYVTWLVGVDHELFRRSRHDDPDVFRRQSQGFLGNETVIHGLSAAIGSAERNTMLRERMIRGLATIVRELRRDPTTDPLAILDYEQLRKGIDPAKVNVGQATRDMVFGAFQEFFVSDGTKGMADCWRFAAGRI